MRRRPLTALAALAPAPRVPVDPTVRNDAASNPAIRRMFDAKIDEWLRSRTTSICRPADPRRVENA